jgi:hypothetical protein
VHCNTQHEHWPSEQTDPNPHQSPVLRLLDGAGPAACIPAAAREILEPPDRETANLLFACFRLLSNPRQKHCFAEQRLAMKKRLSNTQSNPLLTSS